MSKLTSMGSVLIVEDDESLSKLIEKKLKQRGYRVERTGEGKKARDLIVNGNFDVVLLDIKLSDGNGLDLLRDLAPNTGAKFIVITGYGDISTAVEAMKSGATDFIQKPFSFDILEVSLKKALKEKRLEEENQRLKSFLFEREEEALLETKNPKFAQVLSLIKNVAPTDISVLIRGETGTGKEVLARYLHKLSPRKDKPFIVVDCASIPDHLFESELFGHEKGAYTGAISRKVGLVELADGGTLFLDEIGEIPMPVQAKLLRFVERKTFRRVGGLKEIKVDVRIVSATNRNLKDMVKKGEFRSDLLFRINSVEVEIPPLRERKEDIPLLTEYFLSRFKKRIKPQTLDLLRRYSWPGNVRELKNVIERACLLSKGEFVDQHICLPEEESVCEEKFFEDLPSLKELELRYVAYLYRKLRNVDKVAQILGCSRRTVFRKLKELRERDKYPEGGSLTDPAVHLY